MKFTEKEFIAVVLGNDINAYSLAREFYEAYSIKSVVIGKYDSGPSCNSKIIEYHSRAGLDKKEVFVKTVNEIAEKYSNKKIILLGVSDNYVEQIIQNRSLLRANVVVPYVDEDLMNKLITKKSFYEICDKYKLDYPKTYVCREALNEEFVLPFEFPVILKPSNSVTYWEHSYPGQKKVYRLTNMQDLRGTVKKIYDAGYTDSMIIQEFIPGDDSNLRIMIGYSGQDKKVKLMSMANVLLEDYTPLGLGNASILINEYNEELSLKLRDFLEGIGYIGFFTFDIKYDIRDKKYKIFEVNLRQGRSHYYVTAAGYNVAEYVVNDFIYNKASGFDIVKNDGLWTAIPIGLARKYVDNKQYMNKADQLIKSRKVARPLFMKGDNKLSRLLFLYKYQYKHYINYKKYFIKV